ncbi:MAG: hypothetical protein NC098_07205 [Lachnoclostridium sp.]|nr:hypothetical protein [Lachnoclostridium sp.]
MTGALIILAITLLAGLILYLTHKPDTPEEAAARQAEEQRPEGCCGLHEVCEKIARVNEEPLYFDDEELDRFRGRESGDYTSDEIEEFREVLFTLLPSDVESWGYSLEARGIKMPDPIRDEWLMLASESKEL